MKVLSDAVHRWMPLEMTSLGTDGFGLSETRNNLRDHFEVSECYIVLAAANALLKQRENNRQKETQRDCRKTRNLVYSCIIKFFLPS